MVSATFNVDGMTIRNGILWVGWPADIGQALDGLDGLKDHSFNDVSRLFTIQFDSHVVTKEQVMSVVENVDNFTVINWSENQ
jgi:hypothetical protein